MTDEQMQGLVKESGLDWHRGYMLDDDPKNRYAVLIEATAALERERCASACAQVHQALVRARSDYISEIATGLPALPSWRNETLDRLNAAIDTMAGLGRGA